MFPDVGSTIVPPGANAPVASASRIMPNAVRSLIEPPGFIPSTFTHSSADSRSTRRDRRTTGVRPIVASIRASIRASLTERSPNDHWYWM